MLTVGDKAPDFELFNVNNDLVKSSDYHGKWWIVYFYPKDSTPGCTKQAIAFSEKLAALQQHQVTVVGISKDSVESHQKFATKNELLIELLSDPELKAIKDFDVWQEKNNYGKKYMGIARTTYLIDPKGIIQAAWPNVRVNGHVDKVFEKAIALVTQ